MYFLMVRKFAVGGCGGRRTLFPLDRIVYRDGATVCISLAA